MKKLTFCVLLSTFIVVSFAFSSNPHKKVKHDNLNGKYISLDREYIFTFSNDSLYVDMAGSGCGVSVYKLHRCKGNDITYIAFEEACSHDEGIKKVLITVKKMGYNKYKIIYKSKDENSVEYVKKVLR